MSLLRRFLITLRQRYRDDKRALFLLSGGATLLWGLVTLLVDALLPFSGLSNILRSILLVPTSLSIFALSYSVGLALHEQRESGETVWVPYRARFSPAWRRRIAVLVGAVLLVVAQSINPGLGYTFSSSILGAAVLALLAFIRTSTQEANREELGIPDARDVMYDAEKRRIEREQNAKRAAKAEARRNRVRGKKRTSSPSEDPNTAA